MRATIMAVQPSMNVEDLQIRKNKIETRISKIEEIISTIELNPYIVTEDMMEDLDRKIKMSKDEVDDILIELEVEDFLVNGAGRTTDVEYS